MQMTLLQCKAFNAQGLYFSAMVLGMFDVGVPCTGEFANSYSRGASRSRMPSVLYTALKLGW